ncbi:uncharacterized protein N7529_010534 [Penicillium soppii]|uniref:uncharacterized protein n=1 Tax=Penicillium soppii TaxID=69789 RepID=UPI0025489E39|nr:uncharacterized protein N7529_010534 [Penicillium soppii]KAJ5856590.1 hypothetical protein N7529_010534 [Penicillium soppii]
MFDLFGDRDTSSAAEELLSPLQAAVNTEDVDQVRQLASTADPDDLSAALCRSCQQNKTNAARTLLETGQCDVNAAVDGDTPLFLAAEKANLAIVKLLLRHGADVTTMSKNKREKPPRFTPLHGLVDGIPHHQKLEDLSRYEELMQILLDAGCDINAQDAHGNTALLLAFHKEVPLILFLLQHGADPHIAEDRGGTPAHFFHSPLDHPEWLKTLMAHGARLDIVRDEGGDTPLHAYASKLQLGDLSLFRPFVSDWSITDAKGNTLLHTAVAKHRRGSATVAELLNLGLDPHQRNNKGRQPIHMVDGSGEDLHDVLDVLFAAGADLEAKDYKGCTLLTKAMLGYPQWNCRELVPYLISRGADINAQDYKGNGVLSFLIQPYEFQTEYLEFLLSHGADPKMPNHEGDTLLHNLAAKFATIREDTALSAILKLLKMGISPTVRNLQGRTALHMLCSQSSDHLFAAAADRGKCAIDLLLDAGFDSAMNIPDHDGIRPIHLAATVSEHLVGKLIARGADAMSHTKEGRNILHIASTARQSNVVGLLLDYYDAECKTSLIDAQSKHGRTPLHVACRSGRVETVNLLLAHGADISIKDKSYTPLDACAESLIEEQLWQGADDLENTMNTRSAAGVLEEDDERPKQPMSPNKHLRENPRKIGWKGEITSESSTIGIGRIVRALVSHGALAHISGSGNDPMYHAVFQGNEEMAAELDRALRESGIQPGKSRYRTIETECLLLRSQHLPEMLQETFRRYVSARDVVSMVLQGHHREVVEALEKSTTSVTDLSSLPEILMALARWGYSDLFERIGSIRAGNSWINGGDINRLEKPTSYLLTAAQRELPNLDVIKVMVEKFHADVNIRFEADMVDIPKVYYQSKMKLARHYKPGDTILHQLAQGTHWWYEEAIRYLLQHGADPNARNDQGNTPLSNAVLQGELGGHRQHIIAQILLEGGADPNITALCGLTPLSLSAHNTQLFQLLLNNGAIPSQDHPMELFSALSRFNSDVLSTLLDMGLDCNNTVLSDAQPHWHTHRCPKNPSNKPFVLHPLHYISLLQFNEAHSRDHASRMIRILLDRGANPFLHCNRNEKMILHEIFSQGGVIQPWLEMEDLELETRDPTGRTLLLAAAGCIIGTNSYACVLPAFPFRGGWSSPAAWQEGDPTRAMTLYERGADLTASDNNGDNALHHLAGLETSQDHFFRVEALRTLKLFAEKAPELVHQTNADGKTPMSLAKENNRSWAVEALQLYEVNDQQ